MEMTLEDFQKYFELISVQAFCERYGLSVEYYRAILAGRRKLAKKSAQKLYAAILAYEADQKAVLK